MSDKAREWTITAPAVTNYGPSINVRPPAEAYATMKPGETVTFREVLPMDKETEADIDQVDDVFGAAGNTIYGDELAAWKRIKARLGA